MFCKLPFKYAKVFLFILHILSLECNFPFRLRQSMKIAFVSQFTYQLDLEMDSNAEIAIEEFLNRATSCFYVAYMLSIFSRNL